MTYATIRLSGDLPADATCGVDGCCEPAHRAAIVETTVEELRVPLCLSHAIDAGVWPVPLPRRGGAA